MEFKLENILSAVNAAGFASQEELDAWVKRGKLLVKISALQTTNGVLDAQMRGVAQKNESDKQKNVAAIEDLQAQLAQLAG